MLDRDKGISTSDTAGAEAKADGRSKKKLSRRTLLKGAAVVAGAAAGSLRGEDPLCLADPGLEIFDWPS